MAISCSVKYVGDERLAGKVFSEVSSMLPGFRGGSLDRLVCVLPIKPLFREHEERRLAGVKSARKLHVAFHLFGIHVQSLDELAHGHEHVIHQRARVGQNDALNGAVADIAFVPESDVLQGGYCVPAKDAGYTAQAVRR